MEDREFAYHLKLLNNLLEKPAARIFILHTPYNKTQQETIDKICMKSIAIIGQVEFVPPLEDKLDEMRRLISSYHDSHEITENRKLVILGHQTPPKDFQV